MLASGTHGGGHITPSPDIVFRRVGEEAVLVPVGGEADHDGKLFVLNEVGAFIWDQLQRTDDTIVIVQQIMATFQVDGPQATQDLQQFLEDLDAAGCLTRSP